VVENEKKTHVESFVILHKWGGKRLAMFFMLCQKENY